MLTDFSKAFNIYFSVKIINCLIIILIMQLQLVDPRIVFLKPEN